MTPQYCWRTHGNLAFWFCNKGNDIFEANKDPNLNIDSSTERGIVLRTLLYLFLHVIKKNMKYRIYPEILKYIIP